MAETYRIGTLNINGIASGTRVNMLENFLQSQHFDILFVQEITTDAIKTVRGYTGYINIGTTQRGTAILAKKPITLTDVNTLPSGRGITAVYKRTKLVNIYAPSGAENKHERERFYNTDVAFLLRSNPESMTLGGDFNCVLSAADCTGKPN
jgi:exonuclease III